MPTRLLSDSNLASMRHNSEKMRLANLADKGHLSKSKEQKQCLHRHFSENPVWDYATKLMIAEEVNMTIY